MTTPDTPTAEICGGCKARPAQNRMEHDAVCDACYIPLCGGTVCALEPADDMNASWLLVCGPCLESHVAVE